MIKLNIEKLLEKKGKSKYWLLNELNNIRSSKKGEPPISYTNFKRLVDQVNNSIRYQDIEELCQALECSTGDLFVIVNGRKK